MRKLKLIATIAFIVFAMAQCKKCEYNQCADSCNIIEDFSDSTLLWQGINTNMVNINTTTGQLYTALSSINPNTFIYNNTSYPQNLASAGCELRYDVAHKILNGVVVNADTSLIIYNGSSPGANTQMAHFVLNASNAIVTNAPNLQTVSVPLELASGTTLPSNSNGTWVINGGPPYTSSDISDFNTLIQNMNGVGFKTYTHIFEEEWFFDNFCITDCCSSF